MLRRGDCRRRGRPRTIEYGIIHRSIITHQSNAPIRDQRAGHVVVGRGPARGSGSVASNMAIRPNGGNIQSAHVQEVEVAGSDAVHIWHLTKSEKTVGTMKKSFSKTFSTVMLLPSSPSHSAPTKADSTGPVAEVANRDMVITKLTTPRPTG